MVLNEHRRTYHRSTDTNADLESLAGYEPVGTQEMPRFDSPVRIRITHYRYRLADVDGCSTKAALDALVTAEVFAGDTTKEIEEVRHFQIKIPKSEQERTVFEISESRS